MDILRKFFKKNEYAELPRDRVEQVVLSPEESERQAIRASFQEELENYKQDHKEVEYLLSQVNLSELSSEDLAMWKSMRAVSNREELEDYKVRYEKYRDAILNDFKNGVRNRTREGFYQYLEAEIKNLKEK